MPCIWQRRFSIEKGGDDLRIEIGDEKYPRKFDFFVKDRKPIYYKGNLDLCEMTSVGIVGSRRCTRYGMAVAKEIAKRAARNNVVVISGLARGIDSVAHRAVLEMGGKTIGVLGSGIDVVFPSSNADLYETIGREGLLISEYPPGYPAMKGNFPVRNRLISALSDALVVVEAATRSGSLITAECAIEQGKEVFAVPGNITNAYSMGTNKLIRDGARPLVIIDDLFASLGRKRMPEDTLPMLGTDERRVFNLISGSGEVPLTEIYQKLAIPTKNADGLRISEINGIITILEIKGLVYCEMGKVMVANFT